MLSPLAAMIAAQAVARRHVLWKAAWGEALGLADAGNLRWDARGTLIYPAVCISAGVIAGLLGLGGGLVLAPMMLELGVNPSVSAASTQVGLCLRFSRTSVAEVRSGGAAGRRMRPTHPPPPQRKGGCRCYVQRPRPVGRSAPTVSTHCLLAMAPPPPCIPPPCTLSHYRTPAPPPPRFPEQVTLLISSCTSAVVYAVNDSIPWDYGAVLIVAGFLATLLGQTIISWLVRRLGRPSILVITLAVMFAASAGVAAAVVALTALDLARHPAKLAATKGVCPTFN
jgi:hypothetical protein